MEHENIALNAEIKAVLVALKLSAMGDEDKECAVSMIEDLAKGCSSLVDLHSAVNSAYEEADCASIELSLAVAENNAQFDSLCKALDMLNRLTE